LSVSQSVSQSAKSAKWDAVDAEADAFQKDFEQ